MFQYIKISGVKFPITSEPEFPYLYYNNNYSNLKEADNSDYNLAFNNKYYKKKSIGKIVDFSTTYRMMDLYPDTYQTMQTVDMLEVEKDYPGILTQLVTTYEMFKDCKMLRSIQNLDKLNTYNVTNMYSMFENCLNLETIDVSKFNVEKVGNFGNMFYHCTNLSTINISNFYKATIKNYISLNSTFGGCTNLTYINFGNILSSGKVSSFYYMLVNCEKISGSFTLDCTSISNKIWMEAIFSGTSVTGVTLKNVKSNIKSYMKPEFLKPRGNGNLTITFA